MDSPIATLSKFRASTQPQTRLGQLCGSGQLFRDRYRVLKSLGRGGFGITFLAKDVYLPGQPLCVIKQLCPKVENPAVLRKASERFEREAVTLSRLGSHSQIPRLLDYFQIEGEFYLVQEYIQGMTLAKEVRRKGPQSELAVKRFLWEILPVVEYIHQKQVIHRDIKPPNIIRCEDDKRLVLIDFGAVKEEITKISEGGSKSPTTNFVGTVGFAPPEQLALRPVYASDIYALGVTCLFMLTGHPPMAFDYDSRTGEIAWQDLVSVSDHFRRVLEKMLRIAVRDRYQSVAELMRALELESHLGKLEGCMNTQPRPNMPVQGTDTNQSDTRDARSPFAQAAADIRSWRTRLQQRQQRRDTLRDRFSQEPPESR